MSVASKAEIFAFRYKRLTSNEDEHYVFGEGFWTLRSLKRLVFQSQNPVDGNLKLEIYTFQIVSIDFFLNLLIRQFEAISERLPQLAGDSHRYKVEVDQ